MPNVGNAVKALSKEELGRRVIVACDLSEQVENNHDPQYIWLGDELTGWDKLHRFISKPLQRFSIIKWGGVSLFKRILCRWMCGDQHQAQNKTNEINKTKDFKGLRHLLETHYYTIERANPQTGGDIASIAVPFSHIVINVINNPLVSTETITTRLSHFSKNDFSRRNPADHLPKVQCNHLPESVVFDKNSMVVYFGFGVFVPEKNEKPIARFEIAKPKGDNWIEPSFFKDVKDDGKNDMPAAFYAGQMGLAFASSADYAPAFVDAGILEPNYIFFFGRLSENDLPQFFALHVDETKREVVDDYYQGRHFSADSTTFLENEIITVSRHDEPYFRFRWRANHQVNALQKEKPQQGSYLILQSILLPNWHWHGYISAWWINFSQRGSLSIYPILGNALSLASSNNGHIRLYDHATKKDLDNNKMLPDDATPITIGNYYFNIEAFFFKKKHKKWHYPAPFYRLTPDGHEKYFGYIPLLEQREKKVRINAVGSDSFNMGWLESCAYIQQRNLWGGKGKVYGLADFFHKKRGRVALELKKTAQGDTFWIKNQGGHKAKLVDKKGMITEFPKQEKTLKSGDTFIIGCYCFKFESSE